MISKQELEEVEAATKVSSFFTGKEKEVIISACLPLVIARKPEFMAMVWRDGLNVASVVQIGMILSEIGSNPEYADAKKALIEALNR